MQKNEHPVPCRFSLFRTLLVAVLFGLVAVGQAAAEAHPEPDARVVAAPAVEPGVVAAPAVEPGVESASQRGRERMARRFDRGSANQERRARRGVRRDGRREARADQAGRWFGRRAAAALDLTDEQRDQMRQAMREIGDNRRDSRRQIADARRSFRQAARDSERTAEEIQALGEALGKAQADAVVRGRADRERIAGILTEEQRQQLEQMRERRGQRSRSGRRRG